MSDHKNEQPEADPLPDKAKLIAELHSDIQLNELKHGGATAPSYEEAISCPYPALPAESSSSTAMYQSPPYTSGPVVHQPHPVQTIVHQNPVVGPTPATLTCPSCKQNIRTNVDFVASTKTHIMALLLCVFGCWCCVCCPYLMDDCRNGNHTCPKCGAFIGTYKN